MQERVTAPAAEVRDSASDTKARAGVALRFIVPRLLRAAMVAFGVSLIAFAMMRLVPGDPALSLLGDSTTIEEVEALRERLGLDGSIIEQYVEFAGGAIQGDLGDSLQTREPVLDTIIDRLPITLWLVCFANLLALSIAVPLGIYMGVTRHRVAENVFRVVASALLAVPVFVTAVLLLLMFSVRLGWLPVAGYEPGVPGNLEYLLLPAITIAIPTSMIFARILQSAIRDTQEEEFVETAIIWGLPQRTRYVSYLLKPSLAPTIGLLGYSIGASIAGGVIIEAVFNLPGMGSFLVRGVLARDFPVVQGSLFFFGLVIVLVNLFADLLSGWIDPRTRTAS